jgi:hypothetical protein
LNIPMLERFTQDVTAAAREGLEPWEEVKATSGGR